MEMGPLANASRTVVLDGAAGTYLEAEGVTLHPKLWSSGALLTPEGIAAIRRLHEAYLSAGADVITSVTYQASIVGLMAEGLTEVESEATIAKGVEVAREEAAKYEGRSVAAGLGPYGAYLGHGEEYSGKYGAATLENLIKFWVPRVRAALSAKPDVLLFETIPNFVELEVIVRECVPLADAAGVPTWISLSLVIVGDEITLADSTSLSEVANLLHPNKVAAIGANCFDVGAAESVIDALQIVELPIIVYPNSGETYDGIAKTWIAPADQDHQRAWTPKEWYARGVRVVGGCCRTTPATISSLRQAF